MAARPQHLLLTPLGDYWYRRHEAISSTALVSLLYAFGVSEQNARAALSRLAKCLRSQKLTM
jgi:phenylacetic acid degradation operon negative regulatory protein